MNAQPESNMRLSTRTLRWLAWALVVLYVVLATIGLTLQALGGTSFGDIGIPTPGLFVFYGAAGLWVAIGALIVWRHPRHPVGWLLCAGVTVPAIDPLASGYVGCSLMGGPGSLPGTTLALLWLNSSGFPLGVLVFTLVFLLSPDGRLPSRRWRPVVWMTPAALVAYLGLKAVEPGPLMLLPSLDNPLGVDQAAWAILNPLMLLAFVILMACNWAATVSLIGRLRRGRGVECQQVKWLILPACLFAVSIPFAGFGEYDPGRVLFSVGAVTNMLAISSLVVATAIAIFRYRLYDIDLIIRRTLIYSILTALLAVIYFGSVVLLQALFRTLTGQQQSEVVTVLSTLAIAALFLPLRRRVQDAIDRRFFRRKYDAQKVLEQFAATARDETDLEKLTARLVEVVQETMQPTRVSVWLKATDGRRRTGDK